MIEPISKIYDHEEIYESEAWGSMMDGLYGMEYVSGFYDSTTLIGDSIIFIRSDGVKEMYVYDSAETATTVFVETFGDCN